MGELTGTMLAYFGDGYFAYVDFAGLAVFDIIGTRCVDEEYEFALSEAIRNFRGQLMQAQNFQICVKKLALETTRGVPGDAIVAAERIAVTDDKNARHAEV